MVEMLGVDISLISPTLFKTSLLQERMIEVIDNNKNIFFIMIIVLFEICGIYNYICGINN